MTDYTVHSSFSSVDKTWKTTKIINNLYMTWCYINRIGNLPNLSTIMYMFLNVFVVYMMCVSVGSRLRPESICCACKVLFWKHISCNVLFKSIGGALLHKLVVFVNASRVAVIPYGILLCSEPGQTATQKLSCSYSLGRHMHFIASITNIKFAAKIW